MFSEKYLLDLAERVATTYILSAVSIAALSQAFHIPIVQSLAWAVLPASLDAVRGLVAGAFGAEHDTHFHTSTPSAKTAREEV